MAERYATIIGGGIIGNAVAYELSQIMDRRNLCLLEKNKHFPGENQTARNSGVIHAGIYYDSSHSQLKAKWCVQGNRELYQLCERYNLPARKTEKLIVATNAEEDLSITELLWRSRRNGVPGVTKISAEQVKDLEPNVKAYSALRVPTSGIVEPTSVVCKLRELADLKEYFLLGTEVLNITPEKEEFIVTARTGSEEYTFSTKYLINAAGLYSDKIARMVNPDFPLHIFPVRGEAAKFYPTRSELTVSRNVYPAPIFFQKPDGSRHLTVGVHLTPTFSMGPDGNFAKEENGSFQLGREVTVGPLNRKRGAEVGKENFGSDLAPPSAFLEEVKRYFPGLELDDLQLHQTGIQAVLANSQDFHVAPDQAYPRMINLVGICSPGLTSSLAIAKMVRSLLGQSSFSHHSGPA